MCLKPFAVHLQSVFCDLKLVKLKSIITLLMFSYAILTELL